MGHQLDSSVLKYTKGGLNRVHTLSVWELKTPFKKKVKALTCTIPVCGRIFADSHEINPPPHTIFKTRGKNRHKLQNWLITHATNLHKLESDWSYFILPFPPWSPLACLPEFCEVSATMFLLIPSYDSGSIRAIPRDGQEDWILSSVSCSSLRSLPFSVMLMQLPRK